MNISRTKFVILFIVCGFAFHFVTTSLLGSTGIRGFPQYPDSYLRTGMNSPMAWKSTASKMILPIKVVLGGPLFWLDTNFLKEDPPPPFVGIYFLIYWTILASIIYYLISKFRR